MCFPFYEYDYLFDSTGLSDYWVGSISGGDFDGDGGRYLDWCATNDGEWFWVCLSLLWCCFRWFFFRSPVQSADVRFQSESAENYAGYDVQSAGDLDGDGRDELLISEAIANTDGGSNAGKTYLIWGSSLNGTSPFVLSDADYLFYWGKCQ